MDDIFKDFKDATGLIGFKGAELDFGDCHANEYTIGYCLPSHIGPRHASLIGSDGIPRRHWDTWKWYGRPHRQSRDQLIPRIVYGAKHDAEDFHFMVKTLRTHGFLFAFNSIRNFVYDTLDEHLARSTPDVPYNPAWKCPDFIGPNVWAALLRGALTHAPLWARFLFFIPIYLCLNLLDLQGLIGSLLLWLGIDKSNDQRNHALLTHHAYTTWPTLISILTMALFMLCQPRKIFAIHWGYPGEPPVNRVLEKLF